MIIVHLSDLHIGGSPNEWPAFLRLMERVAELNADAIVISGDLVHVPEDIDGLMRIRDVMDAQPLPWFAVPGNHDVATPGVGGAFHAMFGPFPRVERIGDVAFVLFDSFGDLPLDARLPTDHTETENGSWWGDGAVSRKQMNAAAALLIPTDSFRVAVLHHHLQPSPDTKVNPLRNAPEFGDFCVMHRITHAFVGHWHERVDAHEIHGVTRLRVGRSTKSPFTIGVLNLRDAMFTHHVED